MSSDYRVLIIGYYNHFNLGDEQYKNSMLKLFEANRNILFIDCDKISEQEIYDDDLVILGGGDILNEYFMKTINKIFSNKPNKIIALSVGLPYTSTLVTTNYLNIIDYIFLRSNVDLDKFKNYFGEDRIFYLPDLSILQTEIETSSYNSLYFNSPQKKVVAFTFNRHFFNQQYNYEYNQIIEKLSKLIKILISINYHIVFIPFNTNKSNPNENDIIMQNDIIERIRDTSPENIIKCITNITETLDTKSLNKLLQRVDLYIPMRYHACLFAIYNKIPLFPIFTTRKIRNLLNDISWNFGYELTTNDTSIPIDIDFPILLRRFILFLDIYNNNTSLSIRFSSNHFQKRLDSINSKLRQDFDKGLQNFYEVLQKEILSKKQIIENDLIGKINWTYHQILGFAQVDELSKIPEHLQDTCVGMVIYYLTNGSINTPYNYGLKQKMFSFNFNYQSEWKWIIMDHLKNQKPIYNNPNGCFSLNFVDQNDYSGVHRYGWQYVYEHIKYLNNNKADTLLDLYIDRTFHWNLDINKAIGLVPYKKSWIGVVHHTFDTTFSNYNCIELFEKPEFLESLNCCQGIIVLSEYLRLQFNMMFRNLNLDIPVYHIPHPTELNVLKFDLEKFYKNKDKKLLHIGGWLRDIYSFYYISLPEITRHGTKTYNINKYAIIGKHMSNYHPFPDTIKILQKSFLEKENAQNNCLCVLPNACSQPNACIPPNACACDSIRNNWNKTFIDDIKYKIDTMKYLYDVSNNNYDELLTENIVFINLIDASAVNTVLECMARNTPIIINKHPAIVELLGESYPLYYPNNCDYNTLNTIVNDMLKDTRQIKNANTYLKHLHKKNISITYFTQKLQQIVCKKNI